MTQTDILFKFQFYAHMAYDYVYAGMKMHKHVLSLKEISQTFVKMLRRIPFIASSPPHRQLEYFQPNPITKLTISSRRQIIPKICKPDTSMLVMTMSSDISNFRVSHATKLVEY